MYLPGRGQQIHPNTATPSIKSHGLFNQGSTCYLNSVLQVLSMTEDFRAAVERHTFDNPDTDCIDTQLADLFKDLREKTSNTCTITKKLGIDRVNEQCDAAEYFERILSMSSPTASEIFHGQLTHKITCTTCRRETCSDGGFWHLPIALVDSSSKSISVGNGIEDFFKTTDFSGENQLYCEQCETKSDATIHCEIRHHPEALMLLLKRFEFDYHRMTYVKNDCPVNVPYTMQIPKNQTYQLFAVVDHNGGLRSGHYTAVIKVDGIWYNFNDNSVSMCENQQFQEDHFGISYSAYLLFYKKSYVQAADALTEDIVLPVSCNMRDQSQQEEVERVVEELSDTTVTVNKDENEETGIKDSVGSNGIGLTPDPSYILGDQEYYLKNTHAEQQRDEGKLAADVEEELGRTTKVEEQAEKRDTLVNDSHVGVSGVEDQDKKMIQFRSHSVDEPGDEERMEVEVEVDNDGKMGVGERGSGSQGRKLSTFFDIYSPEILDDGGVGGPKNNIPKDCQRCRQCGRTINERFEQQEEAKRHVQDENRGDDHHVQRGKTSIPEPYLSRNIKDANEREIESKGRKHLTKPELCFPEYAKLDHNKQSELKEDASSIQGGCSSYKSHEQKVEGKMEVQIVREQKTQTTQRPLLLESGRDERILYREESSGRRAASNGLTEDQTVGSEGKGVQPPLTGLELSKNAGENC